MMRNSSRADRWSRRTLPLVVVAALLALAPGATASTHLLRPTSTAAGGQWTATPTGSSLAAALADNVAQPAVPDTGTGFITSPSNGNSMVAVAVASPTLAQGENITGATAWVYLATGTTRSASLALYSGTTLLGWLPVASGHSARWYALTIPTPPTPAQAANLYLVVAPSGSASTAVNVYAGYVDLETDAPEQPASPSPDTTSSPGSPTTGTEGATLGSGPSDSLLAATIAPIKALTAMPSGVVRVPVTCPAIQLSGCTGTILIEPLASSARKRGKPASAARRRKIALRIKRRFKLAAGAKAMVPIVLDRRTTRALRRKGRARARVTVTTDLGGGKQAVDVRNVTVRPRRTVRHAPQKPVRGGKTH